MTDRRDADQHLEPAPPGEFDAYGRRIIRGYYEPPPTSDELWADHVQRNWSRRTLDDRPKPRPTRRSARRI